MAAIDKDRGVDGAQSFLANVSMDCVNVCEQMFNTQTSRDEQHDGQGTSARQSQRTLVMMEDDFPIQDNILDESDWPRNRSVSDKAEFNC